MNSTPIYVVVSTLVIWFLVCSWGARLEHTKIYCRLQRLIHKAHTSLIFHKFFRGSAQLEIILLCVRGRTQRNKSLTQLRRNILLHFYQATEKIIWELSTRHKKAWHLIFKLFYLTIYEQIVNSGTFMSFENCFFLMSLWGRTFLITVFGSHSHQRWATLKTSNSKPLLDAIGRAVKWR